MEIDKKDSIIPDFRGKNSASIRGINAPRYIVRRQSLFDAYDRELGHSAEPKAAATNVLSSKVPSVDEPDSNVDAALPGKESRYKPHLSVKKPIMPKIRQWGLRLVLTCACMTFLAGGALFVQGYLNLHKVKGSSKSLAILQASVNPTSGSVNSQIQSYVRSQVQDQQVLKENAPILILNGTPVSGLAAKTETSYKSLGYDVIGANNAPTTDYSQTIVVDLSNNKYNYTRHYLEQRYNTTSITSLPDSSIQTNGAAFVIILGSDETTNSQS